MAKEQKAIRPGLLADCLAVVRVPPELCLHPGVVQPLLQQLLGHAPRLAAAAGMGLKICKSDLKNYVKFLV
jgi:hypothetical protein